MKKLKITLTRSLIGYKQDQRATVKALGLGKIGTSVVQEDNPTIRGMVHKVEHLVKVEEVEA
ncbi:MAG: 50S ribosomal protein L30 [Acidaminococcaceae bacterium]|nr:50S ribosomal protein L30 [Acidaminococcaceae bacterium]MBO5603926.1 50S ribosomal protein L30 [Acidaminococcaceae bacterium]MBO6182536.1 50S ribosomal protein L30 [Acidaminococcaceae bacterium]MBO6266240.1 50S ribosomal protein L30 [Acidaminococcaceae bacterium]MBP3263805.1 50S ribosomal protein L30 [Acidaminococcaceae bacterium]